MHLQLFVVVISALIGLSQSFHLFDFGKTNKVAPLSDFKIKQQVVDWVGKTFNLDFKPAASILSWEDCGSDSDAIRVTSLTFDPPNPRFGDPSLMTMTGKVNEIVFAEGQGSYTYYSNGTEVNTTVMPVCELLNGFFGQKVCPTPSKGDFKISHVVHINAKLPLGVRYQLVLRGNYAHKKLFCFGINMDPSVLEPTK